MKKNAGDLRDSLKDAHAHFYILKGDTAERLKLWDITPDSIVIDRPMNAPMRKTILGYIPTLHGNAIYEVEGKIAASLPDQMDKTIRVEVDPKNARRINRRLFPRYSFTPPLNTKISFQGKTLTGKVVNLSAGGLRLETAVKLGADVEYTFEFGVETDDEVNSLKLSGSIVYEIPLKSGFSYGVRFAPPVEKEMGPLDEAPVDSLDRTVDLMNLVNKLFVREERG